MKKFLLLAPPFFLIGCVGNVTYPQYEDSIRYEPKSEYINALKKDDAMPVCFNRIAEDLANEIKPYVLDCVKEQKISRPYEISLFQVKTYAAADAQCGTKKFVIKHMDSIDLNKIPSKYMERCLQYKNYYRE